MDSVRLIDAAANTATQANHVASALYQFMQGAKNINQTARDLQLEVKQIGHVCETVDEQLKLVPKETPLHNDLLETIYTQLSECCSTIGVIRSSMQSTNQADGQFLQQSFNQIELNLGQNEINDSRRKMQSYTLNLQVSLQLVNLQTIYLTPRLANQALLDKLKGLQQTLNSQGQKLDKSLQQFADMYLQQGTTLYTESVASSSIAAETAHIPEGVPEWLNRLEALKFDGQSDLPITSDERDDDTTLQGVSTIAPSEPIELSEDGDDFIKELTQAAYHAGLKSFQSRDWKAAETMLKECLASLHGVSIWRRNEDYNLHDIHFMLAICTYWDTDRRSTTAEGALISALAQGLDTAENSDLRLETGKLLTLLYMSQQKLDLAQSTCENMYRTAIRLFGKAHDKSYTALALLVRICEKQGNLPRANLCRNMIPGKRASGIFVDTDDDIRHAMIPSIAESADSTHTITPKASQIVSESESDSHPMSVPNWSSSRGLATFSPSINSAGTSLYGFNPSTTSFSESGTLMNFQTNSRKQENHSSFRKFTFPRINAFKRFQRRESAPIDSDSRVSLISSRSIGVGPVNDQNRSAAQKGTKLEPAEKNGWYLLNTARIMTCSYDKTMVACADNSLQKEQMIELYDLEAKLLIHRILLPNHLKATCLAFSPDGTRLASGHGGLLIQKARKDLQAPLSLLIWNVRTGGLLREISFAPTQNNLRFESLLFTKTDIVVCSYEADKLLGTSNSLIRYFTGYVIFNVNGGECVNESEFGVPYNIKFSPDYTWAATLIDGQKVTVFDISPEGNLTKVKSLTFEDLCKDFSCSPEKNLALLYANGNVVVRSVSNGAVVSQMHVMQGFQAERLTAAGFYVGSNSLLYGRRCMAYSTSGLLLVAFQIIRGRGSCVCLAVPELKFMSPPLTTQDVVGIWFSPNVEKLFCLTQSAKTVMQYWDVADILSTIK